MIIKATGSLLSNLFFGDNKYLDWLVPWSIIIDTEMEHIIVSKRNYYFLGIDKEVVPFRNLRRISYDAHLFGADLNLKVYGTGALEVLYALIDWIPRGHKLELIASLGRHGRPETLRVVRLFALAFAGFDFGLHLKKQ